ncbi:MAG: toprim domain-containing protein [Paracoccaceae bacterium]|nr:toprim domain-containing protein [Paracoccaceae bacterium]
MHTVRPRGWALAGTQATRTQRWKRTGTVLSINGVRFYDQITQTGGGGAINLVMQVRGCTLADAVTLLAGNADTPGPRIPRHCEAAWAAVRRHLVENRGLDARWIAACRRRGLVAADARKNAVFIATNAGRTVTGAEITGTVRTASGGRYRAMARGSRKDGGSFWLPVDRSPPHTVMLTESGIDALSAFGLAECRQPGTVILSTTGVTRRVPEWVEAWKPKRILVAFDADPAGDRAAERLIRNDPRARRMRPPIDGEDWNDSLKARRTAFLSR